MFFYFAHIFEKIFERVKKEVPVIQKLILLKFRARFIEI
jgi:hypothetical protein